MLSSSRTCFFVPFILPSRLPFAVKTVSQDDELEIRFKLPRNQVLKILGFLTTERLVCRREVKESRRGKRSRVAGAPGTEAPAAAAASTHDDSGLTVWYINNVFQMVLSSELWLTV